MARSETWKVLDPSFLARCMARAESHYEFTRRSPHPPRRRTGFVVVLTRVCAESLLVTSTSQQSLVLSFIEIQLSMVWQKSFKISHYETKTLLYGAALREQKGWGGGW